LKLSLYTEDIDLRELMPFADFEIVEVVRRRDLHRARSLLGVGILVGDDGDFSPDQWQSHVLADQFLVALIIGMHRHRGVTEHGLRPRRRHENKCRRIVRVEDLSLDRVAQVPEMPPGLDLDHFQIGNRGKQLGIPVDESLVLVDETRTIKLHKNYKDGAREALIQRKALT